MQEAEPNSTLLIYFAAFGFIMTIGILLYMYSRNNFGYLERYGVKVPMKPKPFLGTRSLFWTKPFHEMDQELCAAYGRVFGLYEGGTATLVVADPDLLKTVLVENYQAFQLKELPCVCRHSISNLFLGSLHGHRWRFVHSGLFNVFSQDKIRELVPAIDDNADEWIRYLLLDNDERGNNQRIAIDQWAFTFCVQVAVSSIFGLNASVFADPNHPFMKHSKTLLYPPLLQRWGNYHFPRLWKMFSASNEPENYFVEAALNSLVQRRLSGEMKNDFLELLMEAQEEERIMLANPFTPLHPRMKAPVFTDEMLVAHLVVFISSALAQGTSALTFVALMLAQHPDKQDIAFSEVSRHGIVDNTVLVKLHYVDMLIAETLRLYPPIARNVRQCIKDQFLRSCPLRKGMQVLVPVYSIQRDPAFFSAPNEFRPERFDGRNNPNPLTYIPFGIGPKHCIGRELSLMQLKIAIVYLLQHFILLRPSNAEEVVFQRGSVVLRPAKPIWVHLVKRDALEPKPPVELYEEFIEAKRRRRTPPSELPPMTFNTAQERRASRQVEPVNKTDDEDDSDTDSEEDEEIPEDEEILAGTPIYLSQLLKNVQNIRKKSQ